MLSFRHMWILGLLLAAHGNGQGTFSDPIPIPCTGCPFPLIADFDGTNGPDLILANGYTLRWMQNDGNGVFSGPNDLAPNPGDLASNLALDIDGDSDIDVIGRTTGFEGTTVILMRNDDPGFTPLVIDTIGVGTYSIPYTASDIDGDGDLDVLGMVHYSGELWYRNNGDDTFTRESIGSWCTPGVKGPYTPLDVEGDGDPDLVGFADPPGKLIVHWNLGKGYFGPFTFASGFIGHSPAGVALDAMDLDDDGFQDVIAGGRALYSSGYGTFAGSGAILQNGPAQSIGNIDCDAPLEAFFSRGGANDIWFDLVSGNMADPGMVGSMHSGLADFNGDGLLDLITDAGPGGSLVWHSNISTTPETTLLLDPDTVATPEPVELVGGEPTSGGGGVYSGPGVINNVFYPLIAGPGPAVITYSYATFNEFTSCVGEAVDTLYVTDFTGVVEKEEQLTTIYPNPAGDLLNIRTDLTGPLELVVRDMAGREVLAQQAIGTGRTEPLLIGTGKLPAGYYQLTIQEKGAAPASVHFAVAH